MSQPNLTKALLDGCIHCGLCLNTCPTYIVTGSEAQSPRGRLYLMHAYQQNELPDIEALQGPLENCLGCLHCQTVCPSGVEYGELLNHFRGEVTANKGFSLKRVVKRFFLSQILPNAGLLRLATQGLRLYQASGLQQLVRRLSLLKPFGLLNHWESLSPKAPPVMPVLKPGMRFGSPDCPQVGLHLGCLMEPVFRPIHWASIKVLLANGYGVVLSEQGCCGALAHHAGELDIASNLAQKNMTGLLKDRSLEAILFNSAGCGAECKEYSQLFPEDVDWREKSEQLATKTQDILAFLAQKPLAPMPNRVEKKVAYHAACHLHHAQGVHQQPVALLSQVPGLTLVPLKEAETCCGSAGIYNLEHPEMSEAVLARKTAHILATGADYLATANPGCHLQIAHGLRQAGSTIALVHPIELLAEAYGNGPLPQ